MKPTRPIASATLWLLLCVAGWLAGCALPETPSAPSSLHTHALGKIVAIEGPDVTVDGRPAHIDMRISANQEVRTGSRSEVTIRFRNGAILHVYENTDPIFDIILEPLCLLIRMFSGDAMLDTNGACVETETPESSAFIHSVVYIRIVPGLTLYQVYRGQIQLAAREIPGVRKRLSAGQAAEVIPARVLAVKRLTQRQMSDLRQRYEGLVFPLPDWVGRPLERVHAELEKLGLRPDIREARTRRGEPGTVIRQEPRPGTKVRRGDRVRLTVEAVGAPPVIRLPNFEGRPIRGVQAELRGLGLRWKIKSVPTREFRQNIVVEQAPPPGSEMQRGGTVHLVVATAAGAPPVIRLPNFEGRPIREVQAELRGLGLRWKIEKVRTSRGKPGIVIRQEPKAGTEVRKAGTVHLVVEAEGTISPPSSLEVY